MRALRKLTNAPGVTLTDVPDLPAPGVGEVIVEVQAAGICGSDLHIEEWAGGYEFIVPSLPVTLGHELAGRVAAAGEGVALTPGQGVVVIPSVTCGVCEACRAGDFDACLNRRGIGMTRDGGFARQVLAPERNCLPLPPGFDPAIAALCEPLVIGSRAVDVGGVAIGDRVLIMGPGTIGQAIALMSREAGATEIVAVGADDAMRLDTLRKLGFNRCIDIAQAPLADQLGAAKFDVVFEATGVPSVVQQGLALLRREGVLVVAGIHPRPATIDLNGLVREQQQLRGTQRGKRRNWLHAAAFLVAQRDALRPMISCELPLDAAVEGFEMARTKQASKVMILPGAGS